MEERRLYIWTGLFVFAGAVLFWLLATLPTPWNAQRYVGTVLAVLGITGVAIARYQLGRSFSVRAEAHKLVTTGLYSKIRNPIYVSGMIMLTGLVLGDATARGVDRPGGRSSWSDHSRSAGSPCSGNRIWG